MNTQTLSHYAAATLIALTALGCAAGAFAIGTGRAESWPDVVVGRPVLNRIAFGLAIAATVLLVACAGVLLKTSWGNSAGAITMALFVLGGLWGNHAAFGDFRPLHTGVNAIIAVVVWVLLWIGRG